MSDDKFESEIRGRLTDLERGQGLTLNALQALCVHAGLHSHSAALGAELRMRELQRDVDYDAETDPGTNGGGG